MKKGLLTLPVLLASFLFFSCNKSSSSDANGCGALVVKEKSLASTDVVVTNIGSWNEDNILTSLDGTERTFKIRMDVSNICPGRVADVTYNVSTTSNTSNSVPISIQGRADWGELGTKSVVLAAKNDGNLKTSYDYRSYMSVDLAPVFKLSPGQVKATLTVSFFTMGSLGADLSYFKSKFADMKISVASSRFN